MALRSIPAGPTEPASVRNSTGAFDGIALR